MYCLLVNDLTATDGTLPLIAVEPVYGPGAVLGGRYEIVDALGRGAFGVVFRAFDRLAGEAVAVKMLDRDGMVSHQSFEILARELRYARPIVHPNVCRVFDLFEHDGRPFLTMEWAGAGSLKDALAEQIACSLAAKLEDARAVIAGVAAIHSAGVTHRDIKPGNVLRMADGRLAVSDFGLATRAEAATFCTTAGTPVYMAPEISVGDQPTQTSDVWSLGMVLHEIFFGALPEWVASQRGAVLSCSRSHGADATSRRLHRVCAACLANDPSRRPRDARVVAARFDKATRGNGRRGRWAVALGLLIALAAAGRAATLRSERRLDKNLALVENSRLLFKTNKYPGCVDVLPGGLSLRIAELKPGAKWEKPLELDLVTEEARPSPLGAEAYRLGCPSLSPDGRMLLFARWEGGRANRIMFSRHPDGRDAEEVAQGHGPVWLPSGSGFVYQVDRTRAAVAALSESPLTFLPPPPPPLDSNVLVRIAISQAGDVIALLFSDFGGRSSAVALYQYPSLKPIRIVSLQGSIAPDCFVYDSVRRRFQVVIRDVSESKTRVGEIALEGGLSWLGTVTGQIGSLRRSALGMVFTVSSNRGSEVWVRNAMGEEQLAVSTLDVLRAVVSDTGDVAFEISTQHAGAGLAIRRWGRPDLVTLTKDRPASHVSFLPGGRSLVFSRARDGAVMRCDLNTSKGSPRCWELFRDTDEGSTSSASLSPDERSLAFFRRAGPGFRLRIARLDGGPTLDLGPHPWGCPAYWTSPSRLWILHHPELIWHELDVSTRAPTGRTAGNAAGPLQFCGTPDLPGAPKTQVRKVQHFHAEVRLAEGL